MNGWQRLFAVLVALIALPALALWWTSKPAEDQTYYPAGCIEPGDATKEKASEIIDKGSFQDYSWATEPVCLDSLRRIASGEAYENDIRRWWSELRSGALGFAVLFSSLYALGYAIGWVWRGFRIQKNQ